MCARADQRLVTGIQIRLANTTPATPATRLCRDAPSSRRMTATATASTTVPIKAKTNRRTADHVPARRACRRGQEQGHRPERGGHDPG